MRLEEEDRRRLGAGAIKSESCSVASVRWSSCAQREPQRTTSGRDGIVDCRGLSVEESCVVADPHVDQVETGGGEAVMRYEGDTEPLFDCCRRKKSRRRREVALMIIVPQGGG